MRNSRKATTQRENLVGSGIRDHSGPSNRGNLLLVLSTRLASNKRYKKIAQTEFDHLALVRVRHKKRATQETATYSENQVVRGQAPRIKNVVTNITKLSKYRGDPCRMLTHSNWRMQATSNLCGETRNYAQNMKRSSNLKIQPHCFECKYCNISPRLIFGIRSLYQKDAVYKINPSWEWSSEWNLLVRPSGLEQQDVVHKNHSSCRKKRQIAAANMPYSYLRLSRTQSIPK